MKTTQHQHVWMIFSVVILCMVVLWALPELQPVSAHAGWRHPSPALHGVFPPPDFAEHPLFAPPPPRSGRPPLGRVGFPPPQARFVEYQSIGVSSASDTGLVQAAISWTNAPIISHPIDFSEQRGHLRFEHAQVSLIEKPAYAMFSRLHKPPVPPPGGFWFRPIVFIHASMGQQTQEKRLFPDTAENLRPNSGIQQQSPEGQRPFLQEFHIQKDRLQHLQVLRI